MTQETAVLPVVLLGCGGVGRHLLRHIVSCRPIHDRQGVAVRVVGVADSSSLLVADDVRFGGLDNAFLDDLCAAKAAGSPLSSLLSRGHCRVFDKPNAMGKVIEAAAWLGRLTGLVLVDCSATYDTVDILKDVVDHGCCVVLANKKPLTGAYEDFEKLTSHFRQIRFESTVGAGLPVIASVTRIIASGDPISRIIGSLSGTLGYVMSELEDGKRFSEVVKTAKSLGYTEPDPRDDLSGMDVARKALILARLLGQRISMENINHILAHCQVTVDHSRIVPWSTSEYIDNELDVINCIIVKNCEYPPITAWLSPSLPHKPTVESLYPSELGPEVMSTKEFLESGLVQSDESIEERVKAASLRGNVLRYVCVIESTGCQVGLQEVPKDSPLGRLRGSDNVVEIYSRCYESSPLVIQGAGAGNDTTAAGVLADIIDLQDLFPKMA